MMAKPTVDIWLERTSDIAVAHGGEDAAMGGSRGRAFRQCTPARPIRSMTCKGLVKGQL